MKESKIDILIKLLSIISGCIAFLGFSYLILFIGNLGFDQRYFFPVSPVDVLMSTRRWGIVFCIYAVFYILLLKYNLIFRIKRVSLKLQTITELVSITMILTIIINIKYFYCYTAIIYYLLVFIFIPFFAISCHKYLIPVLCFIISALTVYYDIYAISTSSDMYTIHIDNSIVDAKIFLALESGYFISKDNSVVFISKTSVKSIKPKLPNSVVQI